MLCQNAEVLSINESVQELLNLKCKVLKSQEIKPMSPTKEIQEPDDPFQTQSKNVRINCVKKEKSRDAARSRRGKENFEFYELAKLLPVPSETSSQLDKASIVRLTMSYLQLRKFVSARNSTEKENKAGNPEYFCRPTNQSALIQKFFGNFVLQSLDGFLFVLNKDGRFLFISDTVSIYLGLSQVDMIGTSIFNYTHPADHPELMEHLKNKSRGNCNPTTRRFYSSDKNEELEADTSSCSFFIRMKSTLTRRGSNLKSIGYKVVHITGCMSSKINCRFKVEQTSSDDEDEPTNHEAMLGLTGLAQVLPPPTLIDIKLDQPMFVVRLDASLRVNYCEERIEQLTDYTIDEVKSRTVYQFIHTSDLLKIKKCHAEILAKGQVVTPYYRWLLKYGRCLWVQSCVTVVGDKHLSSDEDMFIWITYVLGREDVFQPTCCEPQTESETTGEYISKKMVESEETAIDQKLRKVRSPQTEKFSQPSSDNLNGDVIKTPNSTKRSSSVTDEKESKKLKFVEQLKKVASSDTWNSDPPSLTPSSSVKQEESLDANSTLWYNPPNREVTDHSDLPPGVKVSCQGGSLMTVQPSPTVVRHHYPFGIDPSLLNSNPVLAKMLTAGCSGYESLFSHSDAFIFATPSMGFLTPVLAPVPHLVPSTNIACCPASVASIIEELRKDPLRKISPPNKVVLPNNTHVKSHALDASHEKHNKSSPKDSQPEMLKSTATTSKQISQPNLQSTVLSLPNNTVFLSPLAGYQHHTANQLFLGPIKFPQHMNALNSL
uniref:Uncharacterized protein n=1 Tax=Ciona savignyi TaxID=51511 RepID=H2Z9T9_CIOSA